ncbi:MAG: HAD family hydrolase [Cyclonatronaceae bacterium]
MPDFIYFDIDDTLLDHKRAQRLALRETFDAAFRENDAFKQANISFHAFSEIYSRINKTLWHRYSLGEIDRVFLQHHRFADTLEAAGLRPGIDINSEALGKDYMQRYRLHWSWLPGAKEALEYLHGRFRLGFITNGFAETQQKKADDFMLSHYSDIIIMSENVGHLKPHPQIFRHAAEAAGHAGESILYVGDNFASDVEGGNKAGWKTAWYTGQLETAPSAEQQKQATISFRNFDVLLQYLRSNP